MLKPDETILRAMVGLDGDPRWEIVKGWISRSLDSAVKDLSDSTGFASGRVAELVDIEKKIKTARNDLAVLGKIT
jgi:RNAse (barnase) inhibitor barstar